MLVYPKQAKTGQIQKSHITYWKLKRIEAKDIIEAYQRQTSARATKKEIILAIQDTSDFNFTHHRTKTQKQEFGMTCSQKHS